MIIFQCTNTYGNYGIFNPGYFTILHNNFNSGETVLQSIYFLHEPYPILMICTIIHKVRVNHFLQSRVEYWHYNHKIREP